MLYQIAHSPFGFWVLAAVIMLADATVLLPRGRFVFVIEPPLRSRTRIVEHPFLLRHREPVISLLSYPLRAFFVSSLDHPAQTRRALRKELVALRRLTRECGPLSVLAGNAIALIVFIGPFFAISYGIERSILFVMPVVYVTGITAAALLMKRRERLGLSRSDATHIAVELILCPFLVANIAKKVSSCQQIRISTKSLIEHCEMDSSGAEKRLAAHCADGHDEAEVSSR